MSMIQQRIQRHARAAMPPARVSGQRGFTLLEILVAIVVLSIGLLGLAGLQALSLNNNQIAYFRSIASQQAYDIADRIRANGVGKDAGHYDNLTTGLPAGNPNCVSAVCSPANIAISDHRQWNAMNARLLPAGDGTVDGTVTGAGRDFDITVMWTEKGNVFNDPNCPAGVPANTRCFVTTMTP
jgi:type IV pilus assembly protein PilV